MKLYIIFNRNLSQNRSFTLPLLYCTIILHLTLFQEQHQLFTSFHSKSISLCQNPKQTLSLNPEQVMILFMLFQLESVTTNWISLMCHLDIIIEILLYNLLRFLSLSKLTYVKSKLIFSSFPMNYTALRCSIYSTGDYSTGDYSIGDNSFGFPNVTSEILSVLSRTF